MMAKSSSRRGQLFALEAVVASVVVLSAAIGAVHFTSSPAQTTDNKLLEREVNDALDLARSNDGLVRSLGGFDDERSGISPSRPAGQRTYFEMVLRAAFHERGYRIASSLLISRHNGTNIEQYPSRPPQPVPAPIASGSVTVLVFDNDEIETSAGATKTLEEAGEEGSFPVEDQAPGSPLFAVVTVRVVLW